MKLGRFGADSEGWGKGFETTGVVTQKSEGVGCTSRETGLQVLGQRKTRTRGVHNKHN